MAECPSCFETVRRTAKTCPHCDADLTDAFDEPVDIADLLVNIGQASMALHRDVVAAAGLGISFDASPPHGHMAVVGESFHQAELQQALSAHGRELSATLKPEPDNPYDSNAIAVLVEGVIVGHLAKDVAKRFHALLTTLPTPVVCPAALHGGTPDKSSIGIVLDFKPVYAIRGDQPS